MLRIRRLLTSRAQLRPPVTAPVKSMTMSPLTVGPPRWICAAVGVPIRLHSAVTHTFAFARFVLMTARPRPFRSPGPGTSLDPCRFATSPDLPARSCPGDAAALAAGTPRAWPPVRPAPLSPSPCSRQPIPRTGPFVARSQPGLSHVRPPSPELHLARLTVDVNGAIRDNRPQNVVTGRVHDGK